MGQALYRKYRSKTLDELVGQEHITATLASAIKNGRVSHAYLFTGPRGVGKTSVARILAHVINELPYGDESHLDIIEIDAASNRRIDDIRDLREKVHIAPTSAKYKVYIIDEVHMLTGESFNALLKTLEEPPEHVVFILATTEVHKLPATIVSRTQRYSFRPVEQKKVVAHLRQIAKQEKIEVDDEALELVAEHGEGSFRDSISLLDQLANVGRGSISAQTVEQTLGLAPKTAIQILLDALSRRDHQAVAKQLAQLEDRGVSTASVVPQLIRALQLAAVNQPTLYRLVDTLLEVPRAYNPSVKLLTALISFSLEGEQKEKGPKNPPAIAQAVKPLLEVTKASPTPKVTEIEAKQPEAAAPQPTTNGPLTEITQEQWTNVLEKLKGANAPLQSVLRQAEPVFDAASQTLTLKFKYQLHRKRADGAQAKSTLAKVMAITLGTAPAVSTELDTKAAAPKLTVRPPAPLDQTAQSVAAIMGGGEPVTA